MLLQMAMFVSCSNLDINSLCTSRDARNRFFEKIGAVDSLLDTGTIHCRLHWHYVASVGLNMDLFYRAVHISILYTQFLSAMKDSALTANPRYGLGLPPHCAKRQQLNIGKLFSRCVSYLRLYHNSECCFDEPTTAAPPSVIIKYYDRTTDVYVYAWRCETYAIRRSLKCSTFAYTTNVLE